MMRISRKARTTWHPIEYVWYISCGRNEQTCRKKTENYSNSKCQDESPSTSTTCIKSWLLYFLIIVISH